MVSVAMFQVNVADVSGKAASILRYRHFIIPAILCSSMGIFFHCQFCSIMQRKDESLEGEGV